MRTELRTSMLPAGRRFGWLPDALFRRTRSKRRDGGDDGPGGAAAVVYPFVRRNGSRAQMVNAVSRARVSSPQFPRHRPSWSVSRPQTRRVSFRAAIAA